ncbi:serine/threonine protein kinase [Dictyobacter kobayashii]|uniref:serine/threonine protein kinase n=1 Tax=Dictyobacter kobayashii TaxID=2014872 RepID=UPI000F839C95|nr:serine/threonine-protein kinase [Dictyobacter kobayashii]
MSRVYLACDLNNQQTVVLKFPNDDLIGNVGVFERYKREAEIGNRINHPHVQRMLNTGEKRSEEYLVMEYIEGRTLREVLEERDGKPLPAAEAMRLTLQICDALVYCHEHGVFHRDIKPENIMVQNDGSIKLIDFGVALLEGARRVTWRGLTGTVGTPDYMSPEQIRGERGTASADVYAVGVILYEMLCGHPPFEGENVFAVMNQHATQDPPSILNSQPDLSPELATVVMKAIRRDADKRYKSMQDMWHALQNLNEVVPIPYEPESPKQSTWRQQVIMAALVIIALALVVIAIGVAAQLVHNTPH